MKRARRRNNADERDSATRRTAASPAPCSSISLILGLGENKGMTVGGDAQTDRQTHTRAHHYRHAGTHPNTQTKRKTNSKENERRVGQGEADGTQQRKKMDEFTDTHKLVRHTHVHRLADTSHQRTTTAHDTGRTAEVTPVVSSSAPSSSRPTVR